MNTKFDDIDIEALESTLADQHPGRTMKGFVSPREFLPANSHSISFCRRLVGGSILAIILSNDGDCGEALICKIPAGEVYSRESKTIKFLAVYKYRGRCLEKQRAARDICHAAIGAH